MNSNKSTLTEIIKVQVKNNIVLQLKSFNDFVYWKSVYPDAAIISYNIQTV